MGSRISLWVLPVSASISASRTPSRTRATDAVLAVLEDGALNAQKIPGKSALLAMNYFRRRLGYEVTRPQARESEERAVSVVFEHDIGEDGK